MHDAVPETGDLVPRHLWMSSSNFAGHLVGCLSGNRQLTKNPVLKNSPRQKLILINVLKIARNHIGGIHNIKQTLSVKPHTLRAHPARLHPGP